MPAWECYANAPTAMYRMKGTESIEAGIEELKSFLINHKN
jgi:hypothetical protein